MSNDATQYALNAGFQTPTSDDHRPWLWVTTLLSLIYSFLCLAARLLAKWDMFWWDDAILGMCENAMQCRSSTTRHTLVRHD